MARTKKTAQAGQVFIHLSMDMINSDMYLGTGKKEMELQKMKTEELLEKVRKEQQDRYDKALVSFLKHQQGETLLANNWKDIIKYIVPEEGGEDANNPSQYKSVKAYRDRLDKCKKPWEEYFCATAGASSSEVEGTVQNEAEENLLGDLRSDSEDEDVDMVEEEGEV